jgi:hypothetical protein
LALRRDIRPTAKPADEEGSIGWGFGSWSGRGTGCGCRGHYGTSPAVNLREKLKKDIEDKLGDCHFGSGAEVEVETTQNEIVAVDVKEASAQASQCIAEVVWALELGPEYEHASLTMAVSLDPRPGDESGTTVR